MKIVNSNFVLVHLSFFFLLVHHCRSFTPEDNYLLNCGGPILYSIPNLDSRSFSSDIAPLDSVTLSHTPSRILRNPTPPPDPNPLYHTARIFFFQPFTYHFLIKQQGLHAVRLHFSAFRTLNYDLTSTTFHVLLNGVLVLSNFCPSTTRGSSVVSDGVVLKEFIFTISTAQLDIVFIPVGISGCAFASAIEVFSLPDNFIDQGRTTYVGSQRGGSKPSRVFETIYRVNVGGVKITPFNDTLWRTWIPDSNFLLSKQAAKTVSSNISMPSILHYKAGGSTREIAPDSVYMTAQEMNRTNMDTSPGFNITWSLPLLSSDAGDTYLIRLHFCDIVSVALDLLYFDVYINGLTGYKDVDLSQLTNHSLASPYYLDFIVDSIKLDSIIVSIGPSVMSNPSKTNAILNGLEVLKMINTKSRGLSKSKSIKLLVGSVLGGLAFMCILALLTMRLMKKKAVETVVIRETTMIQPPLVENVNVTNSSNISSNVASSSHGPHAVTIPFDEIQNATNNFDKDFIVGSGGFGVVYRGILRDNIQVAVKRAASDSGQGLPEFRSEINFLSSLSHPNIVMLMGYSEERSEMILVYEFMEKGPLRNHLYGFGLPTLSWEQRLKICIDTATGLHYLHTQGLVHRDVKSTNILLSETYVAKIADFGLSRRVPRLGETQDSTPVKGSFGYLDPEYFKRQKLNTKSDVYAFGVVLFEVLCARRAVDNSLPYEKINLAEWATKQKKKGRLEQIVDPLLVGDIKPNSLRKFGDTAQKCLAEDWDDRPSMGNVLQHLKKALNLQNS